MKDVTQIASEAVAQVDHGVNSEMFGEPAGLAEARSEIEMLSGDGAAEFARDKNGITWFCARARDLAVARNCADEGNGNENFLRRGRCFAASDRDIEFLSDRVDSAINGEDEFRIEIFRESDGHQAGGGVSGHGRDVTQGPTQSFPANLYRIGVRHEMDSFDHRVRFKEEEFAGNAEIDRRAVIARALNDGGVLVEIWDQFCDEFELVHRGTL